MEEDEVNCAYEDFLLKQILADAELVKLAMVMILLFIDEFEDSKYFHIVLG